MVNDGVEIYIIFAVTAGFHLGKREALTPLIYFCPP